jgi:hypothetical protein
MVAIERLEGVINVGPRASGGTEVERTNSSLQPLVWRVGALP